ncbi:Histone-lysine N-methyltransferase H3 lysine-9 specific [Nymphaea thermarum]|nr:Histone-lysine N-methyltransferase H3 lysine-9 specific [Nymphaea thermarum]
MNSDLLENGNTNDGSSKERRFEINGYVDSDGVIIFKKRKVSAICNFPKGCGRFALLSDVKPRPSLPLAGAPKITDLVPKCSLIPVPAVRKFPIGCGRNAERLTEEKRQELLAQRKNGDYKAKPVINIKSSSGKEIMDPGRKTIDVQKSNTEKKGLVTPPTTGTEKRKTAVSGKKGGKSLESAKQKVPMFPPAAEDQDHAEDRTNLEFFRGKVVVQALKASPNCPWRQGKRASKSSSTVKECSLSLIPFGLPSSNSYGETVTRKKVRETLRLFNAIVRKLTQGEEMKPKGHIHPVKIVDIDAFKLLKENYKFVNPGRPIIGIVPGVEVGDEFQYRVELLIVGLHRQLQNGIDCLKQDDDTILATSIVASGGMISDVLIYSGEGGGDKKHREHQKLERGNLGLKTCIEARSPVRVIRGFKEAKISEAHDGSRPKIYTYDGLYDIRLPGQPELAWKIVKQVGKSKIPTARKGVCVGDVTHGDGERRAPFKYIDKMRYPEWYNPSPPQGCECVGGCSDSEKCACAVKNGGAIPFNHNGAIVEAKPIVDECGPSCKCSRSCHNRVSQHGMRYPLEVFKTETRGWGVRSLSSIASGTFICEYVGVLLRDTEAEQRTGNDEYLFDVGHNYNDESLWKGVSKLIPDLHTSGSCENVEEVGYTIDALNYGNVGRFINHSCSPGLYAENVLCDHDDKALPHIMLFDAENIPPLQELAYHYNYNVGHVHDSDGNIKKKECHCSSHECTGRLY